jgi:hypothetical protein
MQEEKRQEPGAPPPARRGASQPRSRSAPQAVGKSTMLYMINTIEADTAIEADTGRQPVFRASAGLLGGSPDADGIQVPLRDPCDVASPRHDVLKPRFQCALVR